MPTKQSCRYCFTLNNYSDNDIAVIKVSAKSQCKYLVHRKEMGKFLIPHLQGFFILNNKQSIVAITKFLGQSPHFNVTQADSLHAAQYCKNGIQLHEEWTRVNTECALPRKATALILIVCVTQSTKEQLSKLLLICTLPHTSIITRGTKITWHSRHRINFMTQSVVSGSIVHLI